jgi:hypothetical protein
MDSLYDDRKLGARDSGCEFLKSHFVEKSLQREFKKIRKKIFQ